MEQSETGRTPQTHDVAVSIARVSGQPTVTAVDPPVVEARRRDKVSWYLICDEDGISVRIERFTPKSGNPKQPWKKTDAQRTGTTKKGGGPPIGDEVLPHAEAGEFEYSISLNERLAADPEVRIRDTP